MEQLKEFWEWLKFRFGLTRVDIPEDVENEVEYKGEKTEEEERERYRSKKKEQERLKALEKQRALWKEQRMKEKMEFEKEIDRFKMERTSSFDPTLAPHVEEKRRRMDPRLDKPIGSTREEHRREREEREKREEEEEEKDQV